MGAAFIITLREGLEIALILAIVLAYLNKIDRRDLHRQVWLGAGAAAAVSAVAGTVIWIVAQGLSHRAAEAFEGITTLVAVGFVTWMIFWMRRHAPAIKGELQGKVDLAVRSGAVSLPVVAFFVVIREGLETALFMFSAYRAGQSDPVLQTVGGVLGLVIAFGAGYLIYRGGLKLNLRTFFRVTGVLLIILAATLVRYGLHELYEAGWFDALSGTFLMDKVRGIGVISNLPARILIGLKGDPLWLEFGAWLVYLVVVGTIFLRPSRPKVIPSDAVVPPQPADGEREDEAQRTG